MPGRLRTNRGIAATTISVFVTIYGVAQSREPGGALAGYLVFSPLMWLFWWWVLGILQGIGDGLVRGRQPEVRVGRRWQPSGSTRQQLRQDGNARVFADRGGIFLRKRHWFVGSGTPPLEIAEERWDMISTAQLEEPQYIATWQDRAFWWYENAFYWATAGAYQGRDIKALLYTRQRRSERELEHAHAVLAASGTPVVRKREPIPRDVRRVVWERDEGHCTECGSDFDIQYDHIIPFSMGGSSTAENLQLLCARCNQVKGGRL